MTKRTLWGQLKDAAGQVFTPIYARGRNWSIALFPGTKFDYEKAVGDGLLTNVFMAPILYVARNFAQTRLGVRRINSNGKAEINTDHPMAKLLRRPNPYYSGMAMWIATLISWFIDGNAYWIKVRNGAGKVVELWYAPHWLIEPRGDDHDAKVFIKEYVYRPAATPQYLKPQDVVHLRYGIDPRNPRVGYGILKSVFALAYIDNAAINLIAAVLRNKGIGGILISPEKDVIIDPKDAAETKEYIRSQTTGDNAGNPLVIQGATKVQQLGFSPSELDLKSSHGIAEERVCAIMGLPASIVGFGTGMSQTKVGATLQEQRKLSWSDCIIPNQDMIAGELEQQLLPDFDGADGEVDWDRSNVDALQDDIAAKSKYVMDELSRGGRSLGEAREALGLDASDDQYDVFYVPFNVVATKADALIAPEPAPPASPLPGAAAGPSLPGAPAAGVPAPTAAAAAAPQKGAAHKRRLTPVQAGLLKAFDRLKRRMAPALKARVHVTLAQYGEAAAHAYRSAMKAHPIRTKDAADDPLLIKVIYDSLDMPTYDAQLRADLGSHYVSVAHESLQVTAGMGIATDLPDPIQIELLKLGGTRAGLIDLSDSAKQKLLDILAQARADGLGVDETARLIREAVPAGTWDTIATRADIIARTETWFAQTRAALDIYRGADGIDQVMMIDARLGPTDLDCEEMNGRVVSFDEAQQLLDDEHPNGTRDIVPIFGGDN